MATSGKKTCLDAGTIRFCHCAAVLRTQVPKVCTDLDLSFIYILISGTYSKFSRKNKFLARGVFFPQPCSSAGWMFAASRSRVQNSQWIVSFPQQKNRWMRCKLDSTENPRLFEKYPTPPSDGFGYFSNDRGFSVESSLQHISSIFLLWKRNYSSVVL